MNKLQTKQLGNSDLSITPVGFGAWAIGGSGWQFGWGAQDDKESIAAIHRALELGVNWIDTAAVYGLGHSEEVVARALAEWSGPRPYVFTKCGLRRDGTARFMKCSRQTPFAASAKTACVVYGSTPSISTRSIGRLTTPQNSKKDGRRWLSSSGKAKCAGSACPTSTSRK